jgi:isoleucyl-tRNA synthetase
MFSLKEYKSISEREDATTMFWKEKNVFERSVEFRPKSRRYSFLDGPPFVTGLPHYAQLLPRIAKDLIPRYKTMKGYRVRRVWGWDCHGLPIEERVERKIGLKNRRDIEKYGINKFLTECENYVNAVTSEWEWYMDKIGSWCDMKHAYRTMDKDYMESVIWVFKTLYDKGLIYQGSKTLLYCTRCGTPVSKFEIAMDDSYKDMEDPAITVEFPITSDGPLKGVNVLAWTTTPWTMPSNRGLVVDEGETYVVFSLKDKRYLAAEKRMKAVLGDREFDVVSRLKGRELLGLSYKPPYEYIPANDKDFKIYAYENMVTMEEGTGVVHSAPGFGEIDTEMGKKFGLTIMLTVDDEGKHIDKISDFKGVYVKDSDQLIVDDLEKKGILFHHEKIVHRYPYCYRCQTPLIQRSVLSWFLKIEDLKKLLVEQNASINWVPEHLREGRFRYTIETAPDWCISRTRYWATAMPIWECESCTAREVFGSIAEIEKRSGQKVAGLHRNDVDHITFACTSCKGTMKRVPEVLDCWMESGSMPVGQVHYPFENKDLFESTFPADYIIEYIAQVRAWFYYMHVIANAVFKKNSYKNVVVTGVMAGSDGRKMSKSFNNFLDPKDTLSKLGGDAMRLYLMGSTIMSGEDVNFDESELKNQVSAVLNPLMNTLKYFTIYAEGASWKPGKVNVTETPHVMDQWMSARLKAFHGQFEGNLEKYHIPQAVREVAPFLNDLSTWYIRRSRTRFVANDPAALQTLYNTLCTFSLLTAPLIPFAAEELYQVLVRPCDAAAPESVHLADYPTLRKLSTSEQKLLEEMEKIRQYASMGLALREQAGLKLRQPVAEFRFSGMAKLSALLIEILKEELNTLSVNEGSGADVGALKKENGWIVMELPGTAAALQTTLTPELVEEGLMRELARKIQSSRKEHGLRIGENVPVTLISDDPAISKIVLARHDDLSKLVGATKISVLKSLDGSENGEGISVTIEA